MTREYSLTSESVAEGHPDKMADQISDRIVDAFLFVDRSSEVACETMVSRGLVFVAGEITSNAFIDIPRAVRKVIQDIGYTEQSIGFDCDRCSVIVGMNWEVRHTAMDAITDVQRRRPPARAEADDQVVVFGYATDETPECMPLGLMLAHRMMQRHAELRRSGELKWLQPDGKVQVTVRYLDDVPISVDSVALSTQHNPGVVRKQLEEAVVESIIKAVIPEDLRVEGIKYMVNGGGEFVIGGPMADTGLTGRKLMVDTYGGACPHGGGAFSGKDPLKIDRAAGYMSRYIAKNIVTAGLARRCTLQLAYAIGQMYPISLTLDLHGTGAVEEQELEQIVANVFQLMPSRILQTLDLQRPIYQQTAVYGHFGRELPDFTWEKADMAAVLQHYVGVKGGKRR